MRILIDKCIPLNNGDAALIFSLANQLKEENEIEFSTTHFETVKKLYPEYKWHKSLIGNRYYRKIFKALPFVGKIITFCYLIFTNNEYKNADLIIAAPGGYLHSYYGIEDKMYIWYVCKKFLKKSVGIYSQSLGDLSNRDKKIFKKYGKEYDFIYLRDPLSYKRASSYGLTSNIFQTKDAAFMLNDINKIFEKQSKNKVIAFSVRDWSNESRDISIFYSLIGKLINICLDKGYEIRFISTCQGLDNYVDDSKTAQKILKYLNLENNERITIDKDFHKLDDFQKIIRDFDFVIGTRLHMCILSLINKVPAYNISYEEKGKEVYRYLGMSDFTIDYNQTGNFEDSFLNFLNMNEYDRNEIFSKVKQVQEEQILFLNELLLKLKNK